jgi:hypothetical protein
MVTVYISDVDVTEKRVKKDIEFVKSRENSTGVDEAQKWPAAS